MVTIIIILLLTKENTKEIVKATVYTRYLPIVATVYKHTI